MREDIYGPKLWARVRKATEHSPVTAAELTRVAGCSKQRTYQWLQQARDEGVVEIGRNTRGAALFVFRQPSERVAKHKRGNDGDRRHLVGPVSADGDGASAAGIHGQATTTLSIDPRTMLGVGLQVTGVRLSDGGYVLELAGERGVRIDVKVAGVDGQVGQSGKARQAGASAPT